jgi:hypothetical protein
MREVADPAVKSALLRNLAERGLPVDGAFTFDTANPPLMPDGSAIKKVRCHMNMPANRILRPDAQPKTGVSLANNHVAFVFRDRESGKQRVHVVTRLDAVKQRELTARELAEQHRTANEQFLFSATAGDILRLKTGEDEYELFRVASLDIGARRLWAFPANRSIQDASERRLLSGSQLATLQAAKVIVTPDGQLRRAND